MIHLFEKLKFFESFFLNFCFSIFRIQNITFNCWAIAYKIYSNKIKSKEISLTKILIDTLRKTEENLENSRNYNGKSVD